MNHEILTAIALELYEYPGGSYMRCGFCGCKSSSYHTEKCLVTRLVAALKEVPSETRPTLICPSDTQPCRMNCDSACKRFTNAAPQVPENREARDGSLALPAVSTPTAAARSTIPPSLESDAACSRQAGISFDKQETPRTDAVIGLAAWEGEDRARKLADLARQLERELVKAEMQNFDHETAIAALEHDLRKATNHG